MHGVALAAVLALQLLHHLPMLCSAYEFYKTKIPNGDKVKDGDNNPWPGVGHTASAGGGARNPFGKDFALAGRTWTEALCKKDSDGDGLSNGLELGDPDCQWSEGQTPQFDTGITHPGFATTEDVAREVKTCTSQYKVPSTTVADQSILNLTFPEYGVPGKATTYAKYAFNLYDEVRNAGLEPNGGSFYGIRFGIIKKSEALHHLILYGCESQPRGKILQEPSETDSMSCESMRYAWAVGGDDFCLPPSVGIEFAMGRDAAWHVIEIHYDNPRLQTNIVDSSGVSIQLVRKKPGISSQQLADYQPAGFMWVGVALGESISIPPKMQTYHLQSRCSFPQLPTEGVSVFAYVNHAHLLGRKLWTTLERESKYKHDIGCDTAYDFDLQQIKAFEDHVQIYGDDVLRANCVYNSLERTAYTYGGDETNNEMCINFLVYYPEVPKLKRCLSKNPKIIPQTCAGVHKCCDGLNATICTEVCQGSAGSSWILSHMVLMMVSWLIIIPSGTAASSMREKCCKGKDGTWFKWHRGLQVLGLILATVGTIIAMASISSHADNLHKILGIVIMVVAWCQPLNAFFRPKTPIVGQTKSAKRKRWEIIHKCCGGFTLLASLLNVAFGINAAETLYGKRSIALIGWIWSGLCASWVGFVVYQSLHRTFASPSKEQKAESVSEKGVSMATTQAS